MTTNFLYFNSRDEFYRIDISKIVYFESDGNYTNIILKNKLKGTITMNLAQTQKLLSETLKDKAKTFARIGKRYIVNLNFVYHIEILNQKLTLSDGDTFFFKIPISKEALKQLRSMYVSPIESKNKNQESK